jgi:hypothetical protein
MGHFYLVLAGLAVLLTGCGKDEQPAATAPSAAPAAHVTSTCFTLRPEHPPTSGCVEAIVSMPLPAEGALWKVNGQIVAGQTGTRLCRDAFRSGDDVQVQIVLDGQPQSRALKAVNAPPRVTDVTYSVDPTTVKADAVAVDADGDRVDFRYEWVINGEVDLSLTEASIPRSRVGLADSLQVRIVPNDGTEDGPVYASRQLTLPNLPPRIVSRPPLKYDAYEYLYQVKAADVENDRLAFALEHPPTGMTIDKSSGLLRWPLKEVLPGEYRIKIVVRDSQGGEGSQEFVLNLAEPPEK